MIARRGWLALAALAPWTTPASGGVAPRALVFPRDHGAHPDTRTEWWYATGWLQDETARGETPAFGFQLTFFRSRTGLGAGLASRFAARGPGAGPIASWVSVFSTGPTETRVTSAPSAAGTTRGRSPPTLLAEAAPVAAGRS